MKSKNEIKKEQNERALIDMPFKRSLKLTTPYMTGDDVEIVQFRLAHLKVFGYVDCDGVFGAMTETAAKNYQRAFNLTVDGIVGRVTWNSLFEIGEDTGVESTFIKDAIVKKLVEYAYLRERATTSSKILDKIPSGAVMRTSKKVRPVGETLDWYKVQYTTKTGYVRSDLVDITGSGAIGPQPEYDYYRTGEVKPSHEVNVRKGPSINTTHLGTLLGGQRVNISKRTKPTGDAFYWYKITYKGGYGYVRADFILITSGASTDAGFTRSLKVTSPLMEGSDVKRVQEKLIDKGYLGGSADGLYGNVTANAVIHFQRDNGLADDGVVGSITWNKLFGSTSGGNTEIVYNRAGKINDTVQSVNVRKLPTTSANPPLGQLHGGNDISISRKVKPSGDPYIWYRIAFEGGYGYIREDFVTLYDDDFTDGNTGNVGNIKKCWTWW